MRNIDLFYHKRYSSHFEFSETKEAVISTLIYEYCAIKKITYSYIRAKNQLSDIEICFFNGERSKWNADKLDGAYIRQFGISVSNDGKRVFFQTWENGLYCFDSHSGEKLWRTKSKRGITNIFVNDETLCCMQREKALQLIDIRTGDVLKEKKAADWGFTALDHNRIECQTSARKREIIDPEPLESI